MRTFLLTLAALSFVATSATAEFKISFTWAGTPACNTGKAKTVGSPQFVVSGLPAGTDTIRFKMKDLDAPRYNHGGGKVSMNRDGVIPAGSFKYKGPCPPREVHTYQWTATAKQGNQTLGEAVARRKFPE